jgi:F-type H+-transporting ATPase subunit gamma
MWGLVAVALSAVVASAGPNVMPSLTQKSVFPAVNKFPAFGGRSAGFRQSVGPVKGGKILELQDKVRSVTSSKKITQAMRVVAAAKVRRAQDAVKQSTPFAEMLDKVVGTLLQKLNMDAVELPLLEQRPLKKVTLVSVTGDRGLCGPYNSRAIKKVEARIAELTELKIPFELVTVGKKGTLYFDRRVGVAAKFDCPQKVTADFARDIANLIFQKYLAGETDRVEVIYTKFESLLNSEPQIRSVLPLSPADLLEKLQSKEPKKLKKDDVVLEADKAFDDVNPDMILDQKPETLIEVVVPLYVNGQILRSIQDSVASELASRMTAMQSATDNAAALLKETTLLMNRARQAEVTQEILEVVAGAEAANNR